MYKDRRRSKGKRSPESRRGPKKNDIELDDCKRFLITLKQQCDKKATLPKVSNFLLRADRPSVLVENNIEEESDTTVCLDAYYLVGLKLQRVEATTDYKIAMPLFDGIMNTLQGFLKLDTLRLNNCKLTHEHISLLAENLNTKLTLTELSLNLNPNKEENFYKLINVRLKILSLSFCKITVKGLRLMANEFVRCPIKEASLVHLDLSHNWVFDEGAEFVANILRSNRSLKSLNIADCKIGDEGFTKIADSFVKFMLNEDELRERRLLRYKYFRLKSMVESVDEETKASIEEELKQVEQTMDIHPFLEETSVEGEELACNGNWTLQHINISYNTLSRTCFDHLVIIVKAQAITFGVNKGLKRVLCEGICRNKITGCDDLKADLSSFLLAKDMGRLSISGSSVVKETTEQSYSGSSNFIE